MQTLKRLLRSDEIALALEKVAQSIVGKYPQHDQLVIMGMATRGVPIARRLRDLLSDHWKQEIQCGTLDATYYRDDFHFRKHLTQPTMRVSDLQGGIDGKHVLLVDDVLFTGRSVRAAIEALMDMGRAASISLFVLVDRGRRELPIAPDYVCLTLSTTAGQEIRVRLLPVDSEDAVDLVDVGEAN